MCLASGPKTSTAASMMNGVAQHATDAHSSMERPPEPPAATSECAGSARMDA